jgi:hypothetical protein
LRSERIKVFWLFQLSGGKRGNVYLTSSFKVEEGGSMLRSKCWAIALLGSLYAAAPCRIAAAATPCSYTTFTTSYTAHDGHGRFPVKAWTPTCAGSYPLGIVVGGTEQCPNPLSCPTGYGSYAETIGQDAAKHGIITAAVHYDSKEAHFCGCTGSEAGSGETPQGQAI